MCGEFTGDRWILRTKGSNAGKVSIWWRHHVLCCSYVRSGVPEAGIGTCKCILQYPWVCSYLSLPLIPASDTQVLIGVIQYECFFNFSQWLALKVNTFCERILKSREHKCDIMSMLKDLCDSNVWEIQFEFMDAYGLVQRREMNEK